ncbi:MAG: DsbA family protein [Micromonosporaceae bacterium]|nr:DsbA family protein [Micromonosporaceae bacterium]
MTTPFEVTGGHLTVPVTMEDRIRGPLHAPVSLVEYGDFQCPHCASAYPVVREVMHQRPDTVQFVYRHFPLPNVHPYAEYAAEVSEATAARDLFWEMHDWMFEHSADLATTTIRIGLRDLGLQPAVIESEVDSHLYLDKVRSDFVGGVRSGVNGTPTFYVNGVRLDRGYAVADLLAAVDERIAVG